MCLAGLINFNQFSNMKRHPATGSESWTILSNREQQKQNPTAEL